MSIETLYDDVDAIWHFNNSLADAKGVHGLTNFGSTFDEINVKLGIASIYQDGLNDRMEAAAHAAWNYGLGDFGVGFWLRPDALGSVQHLIGTAWRDGSWNGGWLIYHHADGDLAMGLPGASEMRQTGTPGLTAGNFHLCFIERTSGFVRFTVDNVDKGGGNYNANFLNFRLNFGDFNHAASRFAGNFDEVISMKGRAFTSVEKTFLWNDGAGVEISPSGIILPRRGLGRGLNRGLGRGL